MANKEVPKGSAVFRTKSGGEVLITPNSDARKNSEDLLAAEEEAKKNKE